MLDFLHRLALRLWPWRALFWVLAGLALAGFGLSLFGPSAWRGEVLTVAALALAMWAVIAGGLIYGLQLPPPVVDPASGWRVRLGARIRRLGLKLFALLIGVLVLGASYASLRVLGMALQQL